MDKEKNVKFLGYLLPRGTPVGSPDGDVTVEKFIALYRAKGATGCVLCGVEHKTVFAFHSFIEGATGDIGICRKCLGRFNTRELVIDNKGSSMSLPVVRVADKTCAVTGWVTEADIVLGEVSESSLEYRRKMKVWLDPKLEPERELNRVQGIYYIVEIAGYEFKFEHYKDVLRFSHVKDRLYCGVDYLLEVIERGEVWTEGDVSVWVVHEVNE